MANTSLEFRDNLGSGAQSGAQTSATVLAVNPARTGLMIQNQSTAVMDVYFGPSASSSVYHFVLKGCTGAADGTGGSISMMDGNIYRGLVTAYSTSFSYSVLEL